MDDDEQLVAWARALNRPEVTPGPRAADDGDTAGRPAPSPTGRPAKTKPKGMPMRASDRWLTPAVVCCLIVVGGVLIGGVIASVTWLTARGQDPDPMLRLTAQVTGAVASCLTLLLQIVTRRTQASVERQAGRLASGVEDVLDELDATRGRHTRTETQ